MWLRASVVMILVVALGSCSGSESDSPDGGVSPQGNLSPEVQSAFDAAEDDEMTASLRGLSGSIAGLRRRIEKAFPEVAALIEGDGGTEKRLLDELSAGAADANDDTRFMIYAYALEQRGAIGVSNNLRDFLRNELNGPLQKTPHFLAEAISMLEGHTPSPFAYYSTIDMQTLIGSPGYSFTDLRLQPMDVKEGRKGSCARRYLLTDRYGNLLLDNNGNPIAVHGREFAEDNMTDSRKQEWINDVTRGGGTYVHDNPLFPGTPTWRFNCAGYVFRDFNGGNPWTASPAVMLDAMMRAGLLVEVASDGDTVPGDIVFYFQPGASEPGHVAEIARVEGILTNNITVRNADEQTGLWEANIDAPYFFGGWWKRNVANPWEGDPKYATRRTFRIIGVDMPRVIKDPSITGNTDYCGEKTDTTEPSNDRDEDGRPDGEDNCPLTYNPDQLDSDGDGIGDLCDDVDNTGDDDRDEDGISDAVDNCPITYNPDQIDSDEDGIGNVCDETPCPTYEYVTGACGASLDGCIEGFYCSRETIACEQETCPENAGRTYTLECCCDCWEDKTYRTVYDPCRPGFVLRCELR